MTGTRDFNIKGMKKFEDEVYNYLKENQTNHVLYRVTPYFEGENELASGVNIEAYSIEDMVMVEHMQYLIQIYLKMQNFGFLALGDWTRSAGLLTINCQ